MLLRLQMACTLKLVFIRFAYGSNIFTKFLVWINYTQYGSSSVHILEKDEQKLNLVYKKNKYEHNAVL